MALKLQTVDPVSLVSSSTPYPLYDEDLRVVSATISAPTDNDGTVFIGDDTVTPSTGIALAPGESAVIETPNRPSGNDEFSLNEVYVTCLTAGQSVNIAIWRKKP